MTRLAHRCLAALGTALIVLSSPPLLAAQSPRSKPAAPALRTDSISRVARLRASSVVALHTLSPTPDLLLEATVASPLQQGLGSGIVIDANGLILTNAHVVAGANAIHVLTSEGDDITATLIGSDPELDLALVRASDARGLRPAPLGESDHLRVGDWVVAIGSPFGLHHTVTAGIVSAMARTVDDSGIEYLQTDAALSPGSSGGPLLDLSGRVVGINVGILSPGGQNVGLNLAIPVAIVKELLPQLLSGSVVHGWIGVATAPLSPRGAVTRGLRGGLVLAAITEDGPAHRAGLLPGDIITRVVGDPLVKLDDFYRHVRRTPPGSVIRFAVWRNREWLVVPVEVGRRSRPDDVPVSSAP